MHHILGTEGDGSTNFCALVNRSEIPQAFLSLNLCSQLSPVALFQRDLTRFSSFQISSKAQGILGGKATSNRLKVDAFSSNRAGRV